MFNVHESCTPPQTIVPTFALCVVTQAIQPVVAPEIEHNSILYKCVIPYDPKAWNLTLLNANLLEYFPNLVHDLVHGGPISNLPPLSYTFIPNNLASADINPSYMDSFLADEVASSQIDGPYSIEMAHCVFNGHF